MKNTLSAKIRVYSVKGKDYLLYKYRGKFYPLSITEESEENETYLHDAPCPYKASMVMQNQYAPIFDKKELKDLKKKMKLETIFNIS